MNDTKYYTSTKTVITKPMTRQAYNDYRGWTLPADEDGTDEGYLVEYTDGGKPNVAGHEGYVSWSPKEQFDNAYREVNGAHVFDGEPDARQADSTAHKVSRFRPTYRALGVEEKDLHDALKAKAVELEELFNMVKNGRYKSLAFTSLEESIMWIVKELTS